MMRIKNLFLGVVGCLISITSVAQEANTAQLLDKIIAKGKKNRNSILKSYDFLLNSKYKVTVNEKTLDRVKNYFR